MTTDELREAYLSFFESKGCVRKPSDLLVPPNDPSVLFTPAGMNQFKEQFLGIGPIEFTRATTCQKCVRTGDIENVGKTRFHMTLFEMLGNFSFGDYFKREAIHWAWEFCTKILGIDKDLLHVTIYLDDDEAYNIWHNEIKVDAKQIRRCDEDQNYWPASAPSEGPNGVCGPCSEIYVNLGGNDEVEIWNLVFTQFNRVGFKQLEPLPKKNIDTGMGLERIAKVIQNVPTVFDIDNMKSIVRAAADALSMKYDAKNAESYRFRRIADHSRMVTLSLHEGVYPSNEKQGYVVRRLLRRAVLDAYQLGHREPFLNLLVPAVVDSLRKPYPELAETAASVANAIKVEEERFLRTVDTGMNYLEGLLKKAASANKPVISGKDAFELHATYGFPVELTEDLAEGRGVKIDRESFEAEMEGHRKTSGSGTFSGDVFAIGPLHEIKKTVGPTEFIGYTAIDGDATVKGIINKDAVETGAVKAGHKDPITLILDRSPFYGESGGQVGDIDTIQANGLRFEVIDTQKTDGYHQHIGFVREGEVKVGAKVRASIDVNRRQGIQRAHSATHILHWALHEVLGKHATQAGSKVEDDILRFDFSHPKGMTAEEIEKIERLANDRIMSAAPISWQVKPIAEARKEGATALFGEKYGDEVRVVTMGDFSKEFCGGCHLSNTGQAGPLKVLREESVSAGTRRLTAVTGRAALRTIREQGAVLTEASQLLKAKPEDLPSRIAALQKEVRELQKSLEKEKTKQTQGQADSFITEAVTIGGAKVIVREIEGADAKQLQAQADQLLAKGSSLAVLLAGKNNDKVEIVALVSKDLVTRGMDASAWVRGVAEIVGGKGGGKPNMARAGGTDATKLPAALEKGIEIARAQLGG
ncbi:alanine--tRNA ligase [bacterium]|nr:alanine--tRNA ligase [bacterium]